MNRILAALLLAASALGFRELSRSNPVGPSAVRAEDIEATICSALGIDWKTLEPDNRFGRGFESVPGADQGRYGRSTRCGARRLPQVDVHH